MSGLRTILKWALPVTLGALLLMQLVPYGRDHKNPPVRAEPSWDSARTRELTKRACFACHSNETTWPAYSYVAPVSWLVYRDVKEGRQVLNFSEWDRPQGEAGDVTEVIAEGEMPPLQYRLLHSSARLSAAEKRDLIAGLQKTLLAH